MTVVEVSALTAGRQRVADARQRAADLRSAAAAGGVVSGADLAAADGEVELTELMLPALEAEAAAKAEAERIATVTEAVEVFCRDEPPAAQAFLDAVEGVRAAYRALGDAALHHEVVVIRLAAARSLASTAVGEPLVNDWGSGPVRYLTRVGYRAAAQIDITEWTRRLSAGVDTGDLYPPRSQERRP